MGGVRERHTKSRQVDMPAEAASRHLVVNCSLQQSVTVASSGQAVMRYEKVKFTLFDKLSIPEVLCS
jgi:hypothetical protein